VIGVVDVDEPVVIASEGAAVVVVVGDVIERVVVVVVVVAATLDVIESVDSMKAAIGGEVVADANGVVIERVVAMMVVIERGGSIVVEIEWVVVTEAVIEGLVVATMTVVGRSVALAVVGVMEGVVMGRMTVCEVEFGRVVVAVMTAICGRGIEAEGPADVSLRRGLMERLVEGVVVNERVALALGVEVEEAGVMVVVMEVEKVDVIVVVLECFVGVVRLTLTPRAQAQAGVVVVVVELRLDGENRCPLCCRLRALVWGSVCRQTEGNLRGRPSRMLTLHLYQRLVWEALGVESQGCREGVAWSQRGTYEQWVV
jgi:hypothetical protein